MHSVVKAGAHGDGPRHGAGEEYQNQGSEYTWILPGGRSAANMGLFVVAGKIHQDRVALLLQAIRKRARFRSDGDDRWSGELY